jgi:psiF repeat-containing protein
MKKSLWSVAAGALLVLALASPGVQAAENSQQSKMTSCNADAKAKNLSGDDRKAFMKTCLSASAPAKTNSQQEKMKTCNADAKTRNLKGDDRKKFMSDCLKGS